MNKNSIILYYYINGLVKGKLFKTAKNYIKYLIIIKNEFIKYLLIKYLYVINQYFN
jgi:hypothetical protein